MEQTSTLTAQEAAMPFYGPHRCDECETQVVRASLEAGGRKFEIPDGPIYPNTIWVEHECSRNRITSDRKGNVVRVSEAFMRHLLDPDKRSRLEAIAQSIWGERR